MDTDSHITPPNESWRNAILPEASTIKNVVENLDRVAIQIVLILDDAGRLIGTVTDGDVRRGLLRGLDLESPATEIIQRKPMVVKPGASRHEIQSLMSASKIHQIPIVDGDGMVVGLHFWDSPAGSKRENIFVIMAGGTGTRLMPHTEKIPKPMLPVAGKPMLENIINHAKADGFFNFVIAIRHLGDVVEDYFSSGDRFGVNIEYIREDFPLGTAGALSLLNPLPDSPFIISNCDIITEVDYGKLLGFHIENDADATMAVNTFEWKHPFGVVETSGITITEIVEKPVVHTNVNAGVYVLNPATIECVEKGTPLNMTTLFNLLRVRGFRTVAFTIHERWSDVGSIDSWQREARI